MKRIYRYLRHRVFNHKFVVFMMVMTFASTYTYLIWWSITDGIRKSEYCESLDSAVVDDRWCLEKKYLVEIKTPDK